jgi:hypothetical protein
MMSVCHVVKNTSSGNLIRLVEIEQGLQIGHAFVGIEIILPVEGETNVVFGALIEAGRFEEVGLPQAQRFHVGGGLDAPLVLPAFQRVENHARLVGAVGGILQVAMIQHQAAGPQAPTGGHFAGFEAFDQAAGFVEVILPRADGGQRAVRGMGEKIAGGSGPPETGIVRIVDVTRGAAAHQQGREPVCGGGVLGGHHAGDRAQPVEIARDPGDVVENVTAHHGRGCDATLVQQVGHVGIGVAAAFVRMRVQLDRHAGGLAQLMQVGEDVQVAGVGGDAGDGGGWPDLPLQHAFEKVPLALAIVAQPARHAHFAELLQRIAPAHIVGLGGEIREIRRVGDVRLFVVGGELQVQRGLGVYPAGPQSTYRECRPHPHGGKTRRGGSYCGPRAKSSNLANSILKCNGHQIGGRPIAAAFSRSGIQAVLRIPSFGFRNGAEIPGFREVLSQQAIEVFVAAPLPGAVCIREVDQSRQGLLQGRKSGELYAAIHGKGMRQQACRRVVNPSPKNIVPFSGPGLFRKTPWPAATRLGPRVCGG